MTHSHEMCDGPERLVEFFKSRFLFFVLVGSIFASVLTISSNGLADAQEPQQVFVEQGSESDKFNFQFDSCVTGPDIFEVLSSLTRLIGVVLVFPSLLATFLFMNGFSAVFPGLEFESYQLVMMIAFFYYNAYYWITLTFAALAIFDRYCEDRPPFKNPLTIYSNVEG